MVVIAMVVVAMVVVAMVVVAMVVVAVHLTVTITISKIVFPMPRLMVPIPRLIVLQRNNKSQMVMQRNNKSQIATIPYMVAVAVKVTTIQIVVIQAIRKTIMTITKPMIS